jgi:geranylgeranylglycerol-phosphate geranylgeranyltransferase
VRDWLRLIRAHNLVLAAAGVVGGGWIALDRVAAPPALVLAALSGAALGAAGNALNDLHDVAADRINHPVDGRPLAAGRLAPGTAVATAVAAALVGVSAAGLVGAVLAGAGAAALGTMAVYSRALKRHGWPGNVAVAVVGGFPMAYGALAVGRPGAGLVPWLVAGWLHLVREVVKDVDDEPGDRAAGRRTLPVRLGREAAQRIAAALALLFVPLSLAVPWAAGYRAPYFVGAVPACVVVVAAARRLRDGSTTRVGRALKAAMVVGLAALVAGRLA